MQPAQIPLAELVKSMACLNPTPSGPGPYGRRRSGSLDRRGRVQECWSPHVFFASPLSLSVSWPTFWQRAEGLPGPVCWRCRDPGHFQDRCPFMELWGLGSVSPTPHRLEDICISASGMRTVLRSPRVAGLTADPKKCAIGSVEVQYLGFHLGHGQVSPN